ncbi:MAG TPA: PAS domain-containing protein [Anaeromyxobacteraceae bacterium]|nr:PAS domain-containing protein [Anaeromyxobacteraceae bacterium]
MAGQRQGELLYLNGRTGKYLEGPAGKVNWNVFAMATGGLRAGLRAAFQKATRQRRPATARGTTAGPDGSTCLVEVTVTRLQDPEALSGTFLVAFHDVPAAGPSATSRRGPSSGELPRLAELQREVRQPSKEEMQPMNEELQTVNAELQAKVDELSRASNDMKNLLDSTDIATLFLDSALRRRRFTSEASHLIKMISGDVGRPITDLGSELLYPGLGSDVKEVLRTLVRSEREVATADGRWYMARVMPYRTLDDVIDGVVITFSEITEAKQLEGRLRNSRERFAKLLGDLPSGIALLDQHGEVVPRDRVLARIAESQEEDFSTWRMVPTGRTEPDQAAKR